LLLDSEEAEKDFTFFEVQSSTKDNSVKGAKVLRKKQPGLNCLNRHTAQGLEGKLLGKIKDGESLGVRSGRVL